MKVSYAVLAILCIHLVSSQPTTPSLSDVIITQKPIKYFGTVAELTCSLSKPTELPVVWTKVDINRLKRPVVISNGNTLLIKDSRFSVGEINPAYYTLQIQNIEKDDAGFYKCHISSGLEIRESAEVELEVRIPPKIFDIARRLLVFAEGDLVKLECSASGYPIPRISWRRENSDILPTGGSLYRGNVLNIPSISKEQRGTYYCIAENGVGPADVRSIAVEVEFAPIVTVPKEIYFQAMGYDVELECTVEAYPPPIITWVKDGVELLKKPNYKITHFPTARQTDTRLHIFDLQRSRFGYYICLASNKVGTSTVIVRLDPVANKVCPLACGV